MHVAAACMPTSAKAAACLSSTRQRSPVRYDQWSHIIYMPFRYEVSWVFSRVQSACMHFDRFVNFQRLRRLKNERVGMTWPPMASCAIVREHACELRRPDQVFQCVLPYGKRAVLLLVYCFNVNSELVTINLCIGPARINWRLVEEVVGIAIKRVQVCAKLGTCSGDCGKCFSGME